MYAEMNGRNWKVLLGLFLFALTLTADPLTDLKNQLSNVAGRRDGVKREMDAVSARIGVVDRDLANARAAFNSINQQIANETANLNNVQGLVVAVNQQVAQAQSAAAPLQERLNASKAAVNSLIAQRAALSDQLLEYGKQYQALLDFNLNQKILAYSLNTEAKLSYNFKAGTFFGEVNLGNGITLDSKKIESWLSGTLAIPRVNPVEFLFSSAAFQQLQHETKYRTARDRFYAQSGAAHSYYASERFVDWASVETGAHHIALGIATAGKSVEQSLREAQDQLLLEFNDVVAFILQSGQQDLENAATCALSSILGEACPLDIGVQFAVQAEGVDCIYKTKSSWMTNIPTMFLPNLKIPSGMSATLPSSHLAFGLKGGLGSTRATSFRDRIQNFDSRAEVQGQTERLFKIASQRLLGNASRNVQKLLGGFDYAVVAASIAGQLNTAKMMTSIGVNSSEMMSRYQEGNPIIDLKGTRAAQVLEQRLVYLAQGNEGKATVTQFEFDLNRMAVNVTVDILHQQSWGRLEDAATALNDWYKNQSSSFRIGAMDLLQAATKTSLASIRSKTQGLTETLISLKAKLDAAEVVSNQAAVAFDGASQVLQNLRTRLGSLGAEEARLKNSIDVLANRLLLLGPQINNFVTDYGNLSKDLSRLTDLFNQLSREAANLEARIRSWVPSIPIPNPGSILPPLPKPPISLPSVPTKPPPIPRPRW